MLNIIRCEIVTPERLIFSGEAAMIEAPGTDGDFGVLAGHMNFISTLKPGVVKIHRADADDLRIFVSGGLAQVTPELCTILAEEVDDLAVITRDAAGQRLTTAKKVLDLAVLEDDKFAAQKEFDRANALVAALAA